MTRNKGRNMPIVCIWLTLAALPAYGQDTRAGNLALDAPEGWLPAFGAWSARDGILRATTCQEGGGHCRSRSVVDGSLPSGAIALFGKPRWQDYRAALTLVDGTDVANLLIRVKDVGNCIQFGRYGDKLVLYRFNDGKPTVLCERKKAQTKPEILAASITGSDFKGYSNGELLIEHRFAPDEIPSYGKAGIQTNHPGAAFRNIEASVSTLADITGTGPAIDIVDVTLLDAQCGLNRVAVQCRHPAGVDAVSAVYLAASVQHEGKDVSLPTEPLLLAQKLSQERGRWEADLFTLHEGPHRLTAYAYDLDEVRYEKTVLVSVRAKPGTYVTCGDKKLFEFLDPHPVWRGLVDHTLHPSETAVSFSNYLWKLTWTDQGVICQALTLQPQPTSIVTSRYRIAAHDWPLLVSPQLLDAEGNTVTGSISARHLGTTTSMFYIQPTFDVATPFGNLTWWADVWTGDPILRFRGVLHPAQDGPIRCEYRIQGLPDNIACLLPSDASQWRECDLKAHTHFPSGDDLIDNVVIWRPARATAGPLFAWSFNRRPERISLETDKSCTISFGRLPTRRDAPVELPSLSLILVNAHTPYDDLGDSLQLARTLAHASLAIPSAKAMYRDAGLRGERRFDVVLDRPYAFQENDFGLSDSGQMIPVPWCAGQHTRPKPSASLHTAFGTYPLVITKKPRMTLNLPAPHISWEKLAPEYPPLIGDWLDKAIECITYLSTQQNEDGTFRGYERMDHYSLARMTLGLMVAYKGLGNKPAVQEKVALMVRKALERMMGEHTAALRDEMHLEKGFSTGVDKIAWQKGDMYEPFRYLPKWNVHTEMGSLVDQNLGHAHLFFTLLLYGRYVDLHYLTKPDIRKKIQELIAFQWLSQDWNGDIWRVYVGGVDAAGGGDGFEEDLAMVLPRLAELAGLKECWGNLSYRIACMKYGALRQFDYLPVDNEWGFEFLTPMHHPTEWVPEGGWGLDYRGDIWWTGPSVCSGYYGPWYVDTVYKPIPEVFRRQWYELIESYRDVVPADGRHWLTVGGYCSEARLFDPFLGAVKLLRAYHVAKQREFLTPATVGEYIWNFAFYPAAMTVINYELQSQYPLMRDSEPVAGGAGSPDTDHFPVYCWKSCQGPVVSVAGYRIPAPRPVEITLNKDRLGLYDRSSSYELVNMASGETIAASDDSRLTVEVKPNSATTVIIRAKDAPQRKKTFHEKH